MAKKKEVNKVSTEEITSESNNTILHDETINSNVDTINNEYSDIIQAAIDENAESLKKIFEDKIKELQKELEDTKEQLKNKTYRDIQLPDNVVYFNKNCFKIITHGEVRHLVVEAQKRNIAEDLNVVTFDISNPV